MSTEIALNIEAAIARLTVFLETIRAFHAISERHRAVEGYPYWDLPEYKQLRADILAALPGIERITAAADETAGQLVRENAPQAFEPEFTSVRDGVTRAIGILRDKEEIAAILGPAGPRLAASQLHEWVWAPAARIWSDGHFRSAVQAAAASVENQLRMKTNRHSGPAAGLADAFKIEPPRAGEPRLRFVKLIEGSDTYKSAQEGAQFFGRGCFMRIRNLVTHDADELDEQEALEHLAALSVLARWIDEAEVVR